jgi:hypothetical protein
VSKSTKRKAWRRTMKVPKPKMTETIRVMRERHREDHPNCTYGDKPHFVPPSFGQIGFFLCDVPDDLTNHSRTPPHPLTDGASE